MSMAKTDFDQRKGLHALLFVVTRLPKPANAYNVLKCLYYADSKELYQAKCSTLFEHIYEAYQGEGRSVFGA